MSMGADITNEVVRFCKEHGLAIDNAKELNLKIKESLEWINDPEEITWENEGIDELWNEQ